MTHGRRPPTTAPSPRERHNHIPTYKGLPVPYIAAWSAEHLPQPLVVPTTDGIASKDMVDFGGYALGRDSAGVLWQRWALRQGEEKPGFNAMHGPRQKRAMRRLLCQVCGGPRDARGYGGPTA